MVSIMYWVAHKALSTHSKQAVDQSRRWEEANVRIDIFTPLISILELLRLQHGPLLGIREHDIWTVTVQQSAINIISTTASLT